MSVPTTREWLRTAVDRVAVGSRRLAARTIGRVIRAVQGRASGWPWWVQLGLAYVALLRGPQLLASVGDRVHERVESGAWTGVLTVSAVLWIVAAYRAARDEDEPPVESEADVEDDGQEQAGPTVEQAPAGPLLPILPDLRISLAKVGTPHAHIAVLADDIGTTPERVREALDKWQIPVEPVRMQGRGSSTGVKGGVAVHPALAPRPEDVAVVAAGQPTNNNDNNAFETVPDEYNPVRTHVVWRTPQEGARES